MIKLKSLVREGGNIFDGTSPIKQSAVVPTVQSMYDELLEPMGLEGIDIDVLILGSAGKKPKNELSSDLDIGISVDQIASYNNLKLSEVYEWFELSLQEMGFETVPAPAFQQISIAYPIKGQRGKYVQVDFLMASNINWTKFVHSSPDYTAGESKYKNAYRNVLLSTCISLYDMKVLKKTKEKIPLEIQKYSFRLNNGVYSTIKSFVGKRGGVLKNGKVLRDRDMFITQTPEEVVDMFFGEEYTPADIKTFEGLYDIVFNQESKVEHLREEIKKKFIGALERSKLPIPEIMDDTE
jgi:hypothetical protein